MKQSSHNKQDRRFVTGKLVLFILLLFFSGCKKYLDQKPIKAQIVPSSLQDLQALLDNQTYVNDAGPLLLERLSDNYFLEDGTFNSLSSSHIASDQSNAQHYIWYGQAIPSGDWVRSYQRPIFTSNVVLDQLQKIGSKDGEASMYNAIKGSALFIRASALEELAQLYCKPYQATTASNDLGLVLRATSSVTDPSARASVQASYDFILSGLKEAAAILPTNSLFPTRPTKVAAYGSLARTYLSMRQYDSAGYYANLALDLYNTLMDYNTLVPVGFPPINSFNEEVIYHSYPGQGLFDPVDTSLYQSYNADDLRKQVFFSPYSTTPSGLPTFRFQGSYHGTEYRRNFFYGITTDELYLIRAESYAKAGNTAAAMNDLNTLMQKRWNSATWTPFTATNATEALQQIRTERRKELIWRGQRWSDLRRYNLEDSSITLKRIISGTTYTLPPNDKRWVMLIPWEVVNRSGIEQNPR